MIRILTDKGVSLDIDPSAEFEIEYENPMLDDSHMPVPYSTAVALLPSATNCKALGYFPSMMLEPTTKNIPVTIEVGGIPLFSGALTYDSIEDGKLNYTFSGRDMEAEWSKKIWQLDIFSYKGKNVDNVINDVVNGNISGVSAPLMVNPSSVADSAYEDSGNNTVDVVDGNVKYLNCPLTIGHGGLMAYEKFDRSGFTPVIDIDRILAAFPAAGSVLPSFSPLSIVGRYPSTLSYYKNSGSTPSGGEDRPTYAEGDYNLAETLPDISMADLVKNLIKIHCAAIYYDGSKLKYVRFNDVVTASAEDWSDKVSDKYSLDKEDACQYNFGFADDGSSDYNSSSLAEATTADELPMAVGMSGVLAAAKKDEYSAVREVFTGDVFSGKFFYFQVNKIYLEDVVFHNTKARESKVAGSDVSSFDAKSDFIPVRTVPEVLYKYMGGPPSVYSPIYRAAPLVARISSDSDRDSKVYVGYVFGGQMSDSGYTLGPDGKDLFCGGPLTKLDYPSLMSVDDLWKQYHENFATWLSRDRQCVKADLNLSPLEICNFRMYRLVYFNARRWVVRKLTLTFNVNSDSVSARGEFLSYDSQR